MLQEEEISKPPAEVIVDGDAAAAKDVEAAGGNDKQPAAGGTPVREGRGKGIIEAIRVPLSNVFNRMKRVRKS